MGKPSVGAANEILAYEVEHILWLVASGDNTSTGWTNWFEPEREPNEFAFIQQGPDTFAADVMLPFLVIDAFPAQELEEVIVKVKENGKIVSKHIEVRHVLSPIEKATFDSLTPSFAAKLLARDRENEVEAESTHIKYHLGGINVPFGCADWKHPLRSRHIDFYLEVEVAGEQDVEKAVRECLRQSAIIAALATLLTPIGWAAGVSLFERLIEACLAGKLKHIIRVNVDVEKKSC